MANSFPCQVSIGRNANTLSNGKNIMSVMMLAASKGTELYISAEGEQAEKALIALQKLIAERFDEEC